MGEARRKRLAIEDASRLLSLDRLFDQQIKGLYGTPIPSTLYHYTSWAGAEGILRSRRLWLTAHDCTNDPAELVSVDDTIVECAKELVVNHSGTRLKVLEGFLRDYENAKV